MIDALQWIGFVAVLLGYAMYVKQPRGAAVATIIGASALALWCWSQPVVPVGVLAVQLAALIINLFNVVRPK